MGLESAASYLRLGRNATRALFEKGILPGVSLNQKHLVFRRCALDGFLAKMELDQQQERKSAASLALEAVQKRRRRGFIPDLERYEGK